MGFQVTMEACIAGNPLQAWEGSTGPEDSEHVPNDVWQPQAHTFDDIDSAKAFIAALDPRVTTHVVLAYTDDVAATSATLYTKDAGDDLAAAHVPTAEEVAAEAAANAPAAEPPTPLPAQ